MLKAPVKTTKTEAKKQEVKGKGGEVKEMKKLTKSVEYIAAAYEGTTSLMSKFKPTNSIKIFSKVSNLMSKVGHLTTVAGIYLDAIDPNVSSLEFSYNTSISLTGTYLAGEVGASMGSLPGLIAGVGTGIVGDIFYYVIQEAANLGGQHFGSLEYNLKNNFRPGN